LFILINNVLGDAMKKICIDDAFLKIDQKGITIHREGGFLLISNLYSKNVFSQVKSLINQKITPDNLFIQKNEGQKESYIQSLIKAGNLPEPAAVIFNHLDPSNVKIVNHNQVTGIISVSYPQKTAGSAVGEDAENSPQEYSLKGNPSINTTLLINENLDYQTLLNLFMTAIESKTSTLWDLDVRNIFNGDILEVGEEDSLLVACTGYDPSANRADNVKLRKSVQKCVKEAINNSLKDNGFPKTIIDFIIDKGIDIDDLVRAGMELLVGVEETPQLRLQLQNQILKSLKDINVISLVLAGIRLEEDYARHRIAEVDVDDDPSYLYADEVLGMAIANQIAGTKAIFNFKRYDEEKPGIIAELGPILDDVFAGVVAGSMSKIFEE
jgi:alpha-ribazole phosphatase CobZ